MSNHPVARRVLALGVLALFLAFAAGCGGGGGAAPAPAPASITLPPVDQAAVVGSTATFTVGAANAQSYQWQVDTGQGFFDIAGATQPSYAVAAVSQGMDGARYRVVVAGNGATLVSPAATLSVAAAQTAPAVTLDPVPMSISAGQAAQFSANVIGVPTPAVRWQQSSDGGTAWTDIGGANALSYQVASADASLNGRLFRVVATNPAGSAASQGARLSVCQASVSPGFDGDLEATYPNGYGDTAAGTGGGGGDGGGGDGAGGGLGKTLGATIAVTRLADGAEIGRATTDPVRGLVNIHLCKDTGALLLTMTGNAGASYYDESKNQLLPFGADQVLHALVDQADENLGVTPLTEAAYRYAINNFVADPSAIRAGSSPLLREAPVTGLTVQQVRAANQVVLDEVNRALPAGYQLDSLKSLPTPVDAGAPDDAVRNSRYGRMQAVSGGLVTAAGQHKAGLANPGLDLLEQVAVDLTDGKLDGFGLDGRPAASGSAAAYDSVRLPVALAVGANSQAGRFGATELLPVVPRIAEVALASALYADACPANQDLVTLDKNGVVAVLRQSIAPPSAPGQCSGQGVSSTTFAQFATGVHQLYGNGTQAFAVDDSGATLAWGTATCGMLGNGAADGLLSAATPVPALAGFTSFAVGLVSAAARRDDGRVVTFGSEVNGTLGQGSNPVTDTRCVPQYNTTGESSPRSARPSNLSPRIVAGLQDIVSVQVVNFNRDSFFAIAADGSLWAWGNGFAGAFGDGVVDPNFDNGIANFLNSPTRYLPSKVNGVGAVREVASAGFSFFALTNDGQVWGWGSNNDASFGDGSSTGKPAPARVPGLDGVREIVGDEGGKTMYALLADGSVVSWSGANYKLGTNAGNWPALPQRPLGGLPKIRHMMAVAATTGGLRYLLAEDGRVFGVSYDVTSNQVRIDDWTPFFP